MGKRIVTPPLILFIGTPRQPITQHMCLRFCFAGQIFSTFFSSWFVLPLLLSRRNSNLEMTFWDTTGSWLASLPSTFSHIHIAVSALINFWSSNCSLQVKCFSYFTPAKSLEKTRVCQDVWKSTSIRVNCKLLSSENCRQFFLPLIDLAKPQTVLPFWNYEI